MKPFRESLSAMWHALRPLWVAVTVSCLNGLLAVGASMSFVWISKRVVDVATGASQGSLTKAVVLMATIMAIQICCRIFSVYWNGYQTIKASNRMRAELFSKVMRSNWAAQDRFHSGDTVNRLEEDIRVLVDFLCVSIPEALITVVQLVAASTFLFLLSPNLAWILLFIMPVAVIGSRLFFKKMRKLTLEVRAIDSSIQSHFQESIQQRLVVRTLGATANILSKLGLLQSQAMSKTITRLNYGSFARGFMQVGFAMGYAIAFFWGAYGLKNGTVTYGLMVAFLQLVGQVQRPVADLAHHIPAFIRAISSQERIGELEELPQDKENGDALLPGAPGVRIEGVSFTYPGSETRVIDNLNFDFKPGTMTAVAGVTGAGKSTLIRLIMNLLEPQEGRVVLYDPETVSSPDTRCNFMYVPQGNTLFSGTIKDNLLLAKADASEEQLKEALHLAAADFVLDLPKGLDTPCSEVGRGLSEGQAQRISIARALLREGGILVLDEATSALDEATEQELLSRLAGRYKGIKTIICITHRPAATVIADSVLNI